MFSLQLVRVAGYGGYDGDLHSPKAQCWSLQRCNMPFMATCGRTIRPWREKGFMKSSWSNRIWERLCSPAQVGSKFQPSAAPCSALCLTPTKETMVVLMNFAKAASARVFVAMQDSRPFLQCAPAVGLMIFALWGLGPLLRTLRKSLLQREDRQWKESQTHYLMKSYLRPLLLWIGVVMVCRAFDPVVLSTSASQAIKQRFLNFVRSLSTVLAFAYCTASLTQQLQKLLLNQQDAQGGRSVGAQFIGNTVYTAVWIAAVCLFMELLGFSTQRWLTAGGLGTVLLTLAGREIFTNFLSSIMIHATRPFVVNEWIQTKIEGYEVSGTVEHVGWWSPTIIRGDDREAVHIPNHKFTVSVVRNLTQKSHWRIKTHFGISHLDVSKIPSIVADMRKVLAKHPQVEQRRLHRRVFLEHIDPENQSLMVLISCFVKTSHFEEYLRVKEVILLDLLKVISHHHARLATPIRSVQRVYDETEPRSAPFRDMNRSTESHGKPYLLIETSAVSSGQHETEQSSSTTNGASNAKESVAAVNDGSDVEVKPSGKESGVDGSSDSKVPVRHSKEQVAAEGRLKGAGFSTEAGLGQTKPQLEGLDSMGLNSKDITLLGAAFEKPPAKILDGPVNAASFADSPLGEKIGSKPMADAASVRSEKASNKVIDQHAHPTVVKTEKSLSKLAEQNSQSTGTKSEQFLSTAGADSESVVSREEKSTSEDLSDTKQQTKRKPAKDLRIDTRRSQGHVSSSSIPSSPKQETERMLGSASTPKSQSKENLVLGVALDGPKRTLRLDGEISLSNEQKELVGSRNGNNSGLAKERQDGSPSSTAVPPDARER